MSLVAVTALLAGLLYLASSQLTSATQPQCSPASEVQQQLTQMMIMLNNIMVGAGFLTLGPLECACRHKPL